MSISKDIINADYASKSGGKCLLITYDEEGTEEGIPVVPVWKWLMGV